MNYRNGQLIVVTRTMTVTRHFRGKIDHGNIEEGTELIVCHQRDRKVYVPPRGFAALEKGARGTVLQLPSSVVTSEDEPWSGTRALDPHESLSYTALANAAMHMSARYDALTATDMLETQSDLCHRTGLAELRFARDAALVYAEADRIQRGFMAGEKSFIEDECAGEEGA